MVEEHSEQLDAIFQALADSTRRGMLHALAEREQTIGELAAPYAMSLAGASKHVKALERAGLVRRRVQGRNHICALDAAGLAEADRWLSFYSHFWRDRLDALEIALTQGDTP
jgi:DNA-binding transcriptional ArsR family regulator